MTTIQTQMKTRVDPGLKPFVAVGYYDGEEEGDVDVDNDNDVGWRRKHSGRE